MKTAITIFLLRTHAVTNKKMTVKTMQQKFVEDMLNAHKVVLQEAWVLYSGMAEAQVTPSGKRAFKKLYPEGFYSFATQHLDKLLKENAGEEKKETKVAGKPIKKLE